MVTVARSTAIVNQLALDRFLLYIVRITSHSQTHAHALSLSLSLSLSLLVYIICRPIYTLCTYFFIMIHCDHVDQLQQHSTFLSLCSWEDWWDANKGLCSIIFPLPPIVTFIYCPALAIRLHCSCFQSALPGYPAGQTQREMCWTTDVVLSIKKVFRFQLIRLPRLWYL